MLIINLRTQRGETENPREIDILARSVEFSPWNNTVNFVDEHGYHDVIQYVPETTDFVYLGETYDFCTTYPLQEVGRAWGVYREATRQWLTVDGQPGQFVQREAERIAGDGYTARELIIAAMPLKESYER